MLRTVDDVQQRIGEFWPVALDLSRSTYPTYTDGIKTREDFADAVQRAAAEPWGEVLLHVHENKVNGLIVIDRVDDEYVSLRVCLTHGHQRECLNEVLAYVAAHYAGYTLWLGFAPENADLLAVAKENGFTLLDDSTNWTLHLDDWMVGAVDKHVSAVSKENYNDFRAVWLDDTMYWNAERIADAIDSWTLHVYRDERGVLGASACKNEGRVAEIFGFQYADGYDESIHRALLTACLCAAKEFGALHLTYFTERGGADWLGELGFQRVSDYVCYEKRL